MSRKPDIDKPSLPAAGPKAENEKKCKRQTYLTPDLRYPSKEADLPKRNRATGNESRKTGIQTQCRDSESSRTDQTPITPRIRRKRDGLWEIGEVRDERALAI